MPCRTDDRHHAQPLLPTGGVEEILQQAHLLVAADERRLKCIAPIAPATLGDHAHGPPRGNRRLLALQDLVPGRLEGDRRARCVVGRLAHEDAARWRHALQPAGGVDDVAGDHALVRCAQRHRGLAGQHAGTRLDAVAQRWHCADQLQGGADRALGVVFLRGGRAPHGHDRIADELLDRAAVALDDVARDVEVARQGVTHLF